MDIFFLSLLFLSVIYTLLLIYLQNSIKGCKSVSVRTRPFISIVVSMHNEEKNARDCLEKLTAQDYPASKLEILPVNDRSTDLTAKILADYEKKYTQIRVITVDEVPQEKAPKKFAISRAISRARGSIILLTDADGRPPATWAAQMISHFDKKTGMVIGYAPYLSSFPYHSLIFRLLALEYFSHAAVAAATTCLGYPLTCVGTNMAYRKEVFDQLGGFGNYLSIHTGDDDLFLQRVREETDWQIAYCPEPSGQVWNAPPVSWYQFYHQRLRYASKGFHYPLRVTITLVLFYIYNLLLFISPWFLLLDSGLFWYWLSAVILKAASDYLLLAKAARYLKDQRHLVLFPFVFLLHIPYVLVFGLLSQVKSFEWAQRKSS